MTTPGLDDNKATMIGGIEPDVILRQPAALAVLFLVLVNL
jgi:hypothetical protein